MAQGLLPGPTWSLPWLLIPRADHSPRVHTPRCGPGMGGVIDAPHLHPTLPCPQEYLGGKVCKAFVFGVRMPINASEQQGQGWKRGGRGGDSGVWPATSICTDTWPANAGVGNWLPKNSRLWRIHVGRWWEEEGAAEWWCSSQAVAVQSVTSKAHRQTQAPSQDGLRPLLWRNLILYFKGESYHLFLSLWNKAISELVSLSLIPYLFRKNQNKSLEKACSKNTRWLNTQICHVMKERKQSCQEPWIQFLLNIRIKQLWASWLLKQN